MEFRDLVERIFLVSVVLSMGLLFYANAENQWTPDGRVINLGLGKSFYIPCATALFFSFFITREIDVFDKLVIGFLVVGVLSSLINPPLSENFLSWTIVRLFFGISCFFKIRNISPNLIVKYFAIASPFIVFPHYIVSNPFSWGNMRYGGLYGDANYLAMSLNFLNCVCCLYLKKGDNLLIKVGCILSIIGTIPLIMLGMSRGGLIGLLFILIWILNDLRKYNRNYFIILVILCISGFSWFTSTMSSTIDGIEKRFSSDSYSDVRSSEIRLEGIDSGINVLINKPSLILFGIGPGNTLSKIQEYQNYGYYVHGVIHSTPFAVLYEMGIIAFILFCYIIIWLIRTLYYNKKYFLLVTFLSTLVGVVTLPALAFMPFWIIVFTFSNMECLE